MKCEVMVLADVGKWGSGGTPSAGNPHYYGGSIPWLNIEDLNDAELYSAKRTITEQGLQNSSAKIVPPGTLLVAMYGASIGKLGIAEIPCATNQAIAFCQCDPNILTTRFLFYYLLAVRPKLIRIGRGGAQPNISQELLKELSLSVPSLTEQNRVANLLYKADRLRRTRRYALELTDTFLPAAFLELFGDPTTNPLGLPVAELGDFLSFVTSGSRGWAEYYAPEGARFIRSLDVRMNNISDEDAVFVKPPNGAEADRTRVKPADVLLTITGSRIGRVAPVPERLNGAFISQHVAILRLKAGLLPEFISMFLSLDTGGQREIARAQYGQTKPGLNLDQIRQVRVPVPPLFRQQQFLDMAKRVERLRAVQREALRQAERLFASLLHRAFSG